ncbi:MAG: exosortase [Kiritimatiellia bacterium]|jgi:exosortase
MDFFKNADSTIWSERYRLAALSKDDIFRIGLFTGAFALMFVMFHFVGNTTDSDAKGRSAILWMISRWSDSSISMGNGNYSHGWLIFPVSAFIVWLNRNELIRAEKRSSKVGLAVIILACLMHYIGAKSQQTRLSLAAFIFLIWGLPFYFYGWQVAKRIMFPCAFLIFSIPFNFLDRKTFALRLLAANMSTGILNGLGIKTTCDGTQIESTAGGGFRFGVEDPCSGLRSLLAMTALTAVYAYFTQKGVIKKFLLFFSSIPLAIVGNIFRITTIAIVAQAFGQEIASGLYHDYSGYLVFSIAIGMMVGLGALLSVNFHEMVKKWKQSLSDL